MFKVLYYLQKNREEISFERLYDIIPYIFYILYFTNHIFHDPEFQYPYIETVHCGRYTRGGMQDDIAIENILADMYLKCETNHNI